MQHVHEVIFPHNQAVANMWGLGGKAYDEISFALSDALAHAAQRLGAGPGEEVLDIATGTGWSARNAARSGAQVTAVDISHELLLAAEELSAHIQPPISFHLADVESLPFSDARFHRIISTFGAMFAPDHKHTAEEIGRVCKTGGRLVLATWVPAGAVQKFFDIIGRYNNTASSQPSPLTWGNPDYVTKLLGDNFKLTFEHGVNNAFYDDIEHIWESFARGFGPVRQAIDSLDPARLAEFRRDIDSYHAGHTTENGLLHIKREYLLTIGHRR